MWTLCDLAGPHQAVHSMIEGSSGFCLSGGAARGRAETDKLSGIVVGRALRCGRRLPTRVLTRDKAARGDRRRQEEGLTWMRRAARASVGTRSSRVAPIVGDCQGKVPVNQGVRMSRATDEAGGRRRDCTEQGVKRAVVDSVLGRGERVKRGGCHKVAR